MKYIYHHLGLGDHIICNGLVRELIEPHEEYKMFVKSHNLISVSFMFRDLKNLSFLIGDDVFAKNYIRSNNIDRNNLIIAGFNRHPKAKSFDESFYLQNNLNFKDRWDKFYVRRDLESETRMFELMQLENNNYIFIHDDPERNYNIDENSIDNKNSLKVVRPIKGMTNNIFDYCNIIANSYSAHFIDSSFRLLCDSLSLKTDKIFYHINMKNGTKRNINKFDDSTSMLNFTIV